MTGRVVTVSSDVHPFGRIDFADLNCERKRYRPWRVYAQSKLANLLFTAELQRRLSAVGSHVLATAAHPGYAATNLQTRSQRRSMDFLLGKLGNRLFAQDAAGGALPTLFADRPAAPPPCEVKGPLASSIEGAGPLTSNRRQAPGALYRTICTGNRTSVT